MNVDKTSSNKSAAKQLNPLKQGLIFMVVFFLLTYGVLGLIFNWFGLAECIIGSVAGGIAVFIATLKKVRNAR